MLSHGGAPSKEHGAANADASGLLTDPAARPIIKSSVSKSQERIGDMAGLPIVPNHYRYCPRCGQALALRPEGGRQRAACQSCGFIHFSTFSLGVGGIVVRDNKVLFIRRGQDPGKGRWTIPGGYVEQDEPFEEAVVREMYEETGVRSEVQGILAARNSLNERDSNVYIVFALKDLGGGPECDGVEVDRAEFLAAHEYEALAELAPVSKYFAQMALETPAAPLTASAFAGQTSGYAYSMFDIAGFNPHALDLD